MPTASKRVAQRIIDTKKSGHEVVVVVSAMGTPPTTYATSPSRCRRPRRPESSTCCSPRASASRWHCSPWRSTTAASRPARTPAARLGSSPTPPTANARIIDITPGRIRSAIDEGDIVIVAGFQGVSQSTKEITTPGRGASDTTAVALAAALGAQFCEIFTDVDGVFTADPRVVPKARKVETISSEEMLELAANGAKVLHLRCVEYARRFDIPIHVRSSFSAKDGTWVVQHPYGEGETMEAPIVSGVAHDRSEAKITVVGVPDQAGKAAEIFTAVAQASINIDMIVQNVSAVETGLTDISFTLPKADGQRALESLRAIQERSGYTPCSMTTGWASSRSSVLGCARTPGCRPPSSRRSPTPASISR